jgi:hypothetical protein
LKGATRAQGRRLHIPAAQVSGRAPDQVALLPAMEKMDSDVAERHHEDQTDKPSDDELDESPFVFCGLDFQFG